MSIIINNNPASIAAQRNLTVNSSQLQKSVEHLSSGFELPAHPTMPPDSPCRKPCVRKFAVSIKRREMPTMASA